MAYTSKYKIIANNNTWQTFLTNGANMIGYKRGKLNDRLLTKIKKGTLIVGDITGKGIVYIASTTEDLHISTKGIFGDVYPLIAGIKVHWITTPENAIQYDELGIPRGHQQNFILGGGRTFNQMSWLKKAIRLLKNRHDPALLAEQPLIVLPPEPVFNNILAIPAQAEENIVRYETLKITALYVRMAVPFNRRVAIPNRDRTELQASGLLTTAEIASLEPWDLSLPLVDVVYYSQNGGITELIEIEHTTQMWTGLVRMAQIVNDPNNGNIRCFIAAPEKRRNIFEKNKLGFPDLECAFIPFNALENIIKLGVDRFRNPGQTFDPDNIRRYSNKIVIDQATMTEEEAYEIVRKAYNP